MLNYNSTFTIGYIRGGDGDLAVLATVNNLDEGISNSAIKKIIKTVVSYLSAETGEDILVFNREDAIDFAELGDDEHPIPIEYFN